ncbi:MAG: Na+/H+ antiporter subunit D [Phycisphaerales bacterium]
MLVALPILIPLTGAALCVLCWGRVALHRVIGVCSMLALLAVSIQLLLTVRTGEIIALHVGGWNAPVGISLVADRLSCLMTLLTAIVGLGAVVSSCFSTDDARARMGHFPLVLALLGAVCGAFLTGDLFNLYVWFELLLLSSFVLLTLGGERPQLEGAIKYVTLNLVSSILFLASVGLVYGITGTLNMADLAVRLDALPPEQATMLAAPLLVAFAIKGGVFPFFFWLPASYHTPPPVVSALFAGLLSKVGVYAIIRASTLLFDQEWALMGDVVLLFAGLTMITGVIGAIAQTDMRRILAFHIVSQIGYMLMGLGVAMSAAARGAPLEVVALALAGSVFYILHHIIVKTNLFFVTGVVVHEYGTSELAAVDGVVKTRPALAALFLVSALSLAGIPVLSGFWAKLALVRGGLEAGAFVIVGVSLAVSLLTLFSMMKIWTQGFWGEASPLSDQPLSKARARGLLLPIVCLALLTVSIGIGAKPVYEFATATASQLLDPGQYIQAVLEIEAEPSP